MNNGVRWKTNANANTKDNNANDSRTRYKDFGEIMLVVVFSWLYVIFILRFLFYVYMKVYGNTKLFFYEHVR